jgi:hypothetical protein
MDKKIQLFFGDTKSVCPICKNDTTAFIKYLDYIDMPHEVCYCNVCKKEFYRINMYVSTSLYTYDNIEKCTKLSILQKLINSIIERIIRNGGESNE